MEFTKYRLGDIADIVNGATPSTDVEEYYNGNIPWITPKDLSEQSSKYIRNGERCITEEGYKNCNTNIIPAHNILMSSRAPIGLLAINEIDCCTNQGFKSLILDNSKADVEYLYYYLKVHMPEIEKLGSGTTFKEVSKDALNNLEILIPDIVNQKRVAQSLYIIDKKITINRRINERLEGMAKLLYDYWFVQFEFPNDEGKPYKSSGGKMVWNEKLKREIPEGWEVKNIGNMVELNIERISSQDISSEQYTPIEVLPQNRMSFSDVASLDKAVSGLCRYKKYDILLSNRRVYFHKICIAPFDGITRDTIFIIKTNKQNYQGFIYETLNTDHFFAYAQKNSYGSEQPVLGWTTVANYYFAKPNNNIDEKYSRKVQNIIDTVILNEIEIMKMTSLRDFLLPMLMNGQV